MCPYIKTLFCQFSLMLALLSATIAFAAEPVDYGQNFRAYGEDVFVQYRAWVPDGVDRIKGLILTLPGSRGDQRGVPRSALWQFRLTQMGYGIVGFRDLLDYGYNYWGSDSEEARANLQMVLDSVAQTFGHPEISNAPIVLDGVSKGGYSAGWLASLVPERTMGFIADKGYSFATFDSSQVIAPGLIIAGDRDDIVTPEYLNQAFLVSRTYDAHNAYLVEWRTTHRETTENLRLVAMDQFIRSRYPAGQLPSLEPNTPLVLEEPVGWLAEASEFEVGVGQIFNPDPVITPAEVYPLDPLTASWLPNETLARVYRAQNDNTRNGPRVQFDIPNPFLSPLTMNLQITGIEADWVDLYHEDELLVSLDPSTDPLSYTYTARANGLHTFVAVAHYMDSGLMKTASNYIATVITGVPAVPEPHTIALLLSCVGFLAVRRHRHN